MTPRNRMRLALVSCGLAALMAAGCGGGSGTNELVIGEYGSLTGNDATFGQSTKNGIDMALADLVADHNGEIGGYKVRIVVEDDQGRPEEAATVVQKLINQDRVIALLGEVASSRSLAAAPIAQAAGVPMITPSSTNPKVTEVGDYIFRMCFIDPFQGLVMAKFARQNLGLTKVAVLKDVRNDYSVGLTEFFTKSFTELGGTIIAEQAYSAGDQDFRAQLTTLKNKDSEAIFIPGYYTEVGLIARQARELGYKGLLIGTDGWESEQLIEIGGKALNGAYFSSHFAVDNPDPALQDFLVKYRARFGGDPDAIGGLAYDAARVLFSHLQTMAADDPTTFAGFLPDKAGTPARKAATAKLRDLIAGTKNYPGVTGAITLDANRNASKPSVVIKIEDEQKKYNTKIDP
jgi:branched-chain amino acid transport system substrate-binding protein